MTCLQTGCNSKSSYKKKHRMSPNIFRAPTTRTLRAALAVLVAAILCLLPAVRPAHAALPPDGAAPLQVKTGMYIIDLSDLDLAGNTFSIAMWQWFVHTDPDYKPYETVEIVNAANFATEAGFEEITGATTWSQAKFRATVHKQWDISSYPFDRQRLEVQLEEGENDASAIHFVADNENSKIDTGVTLEQWHIIDFHLEAEDHEYPTTYGDPTLTGTSTYSRVTAIINLERKSPWFTFLKSLIGAFIGFFLATAAFLIAPDQLGDRLFLTTASVFAVIGNQIVLDSYLPPVAGLPLVFKIQILTFLTIIVTTLSQVLSSRLMRANRPAIANRLDTIAGITIFAAYSGEVLWLLLAATAMA